MSDADFAPRQAEVDVAGVRTRYLEAGSGRPVVFIHGFGAVGAYWRWTLGALPPGFRGIAPDLVGHGESGVPQGSYDAGYYEKLLMGFLDALEVDKTVLVGNSMGGLLAARLAIDHPARVERLVLCDSIGLNRGLPWSTRLMYLRSFLKGLFRAPSRESAREWLAEATFHDSSRITEEFLDLSPRSRRTLEARMAMIKTAIGLLRPEARVLNRLGEIRAPTLLVWGADDRQFPASDAREAAKRIPLCRLEIIDRCGHIPMVERPEEFNRILNEFLGQEFTGTKPK